MATFAISLATYGACFRCLIQSSSSEQSSLVAVTVSTYLLSNAMRVLHKLTEGMVGVTTVLFTLTYIHLIIQDVK